MSVKKFKMPTAYVILISIILFLACVSWIINDPSIIKAKFSNIAMAPILGFVDATELSIFALILGGFLGIINKTGVLYKSILIVVKKLKGKELKLIPLLMFLFSVAGTTYGSCEETVAFYGLIVAAMIAAGFDSLTGASAILLGAGAGVLGSTINPFVVSIAVDAANSAGVKTNQGTIILLGSILWFVTTFICIWYVMKYAKTVHHNLDRSILSKEEINDSLSAYRNDNDINTITLTSREKIILFLFGLTFFVMVISLIPWQTFNINFFDSWTIFLTGEPFGKWYFKELAVWFLIVSIVCGIVYKLKEEEFVDAFIAGAKDLVGVVLIIAVSRGIKIIMNDTNLGNYILSNASNILTNMNSISFTVVSYIIYLGLSFLIPSTSALAASSIGIFTPLAKNLNLDPNVIIMIFSSACGLVNLITPTSGVVMSGLAISKIKYSTWVKFSLKPIALILITNIIILSIAMMYFSLR